MPAKVASIPALPGLSPVCGKAIIARFDGGKLSSDGGVLALREIETRLSIANYLAACVADPPQVDTACRHGPTPQPRHRQTAWCGGCSRHCAEHRGLWWREAHAPNG